MTGAQIIVLATPVFLALIGIELATGRGRGEQVLFLRHAHALGAYGQQAPPQASP